MATATIKEAAPKVVLELSMAEAEYVKAALHRCEPTDPELFDADDDIVYLELGDAGVKTRIGAARLNGLGS